MKSSRRILIITTGQLSRNPRASKEAATLAQSGYDVSVLHVRHHRSGEEIDSSSMGTAAFRRVCVDLIPGFGASPLAIWTTRAITRMARTLTRQAGLETNWSLGPYGLLLDRARSIPAELTIVHNELAHSVGIKLSHENRRIAADIEDWHSEDLLPEARESRPQRLLRRNERFLLHNARYTTTTSHALAEALHIRYGGHEPHVIANAFPLQADPRPVRAHTGEPPAFFWFSQTLGPGRGIEAFVAAWQAMQVTSRLVLLGEPVTDYRQKLLDSLSPDKRSRVSFLDLVPPDKLPSLIAKYDIGLALEDASIPSRNLTITNKVLQYLNAGLAIVVTNTAGQREVLAQSPEAGIIIHRDHIEETAAQLDALVSSQERLATAQRRARQLAEDVYCWEREAPKLVRLVEHALTSA